MRNRIRKPRVSNSVRIYHKLPRGRRRTQRRTVLDAEFRDYFAKHRDAVYRTRRNDELVVTRGRIAVASGCHHAHVVEAGHAVEVNR